MIKSIYIKDFAIIDELRVDLNDGLTVFIGETGAGKSIIVGAISFLNAQRADASYVHKGKDKAIIEGVFALNDKIKGMEKRWKIKTARSASLQMKTNG